MNGKMRTALEVWIKETKATEIDAKSLLQLKVMDGYC